MSYATFEGEIPKGQYGAGRVEVTDSGEGEPRVLSPELRTPSGRGLRIVDQVSDTWGVTSRSKGRESNTAP